MVFLSPPNSNGLALSTFQARTNPPLTRALADWEIKRPLCLESGEAVNAGTGVRASKTPKLTLYRQHTRIGADPGDTEQRLETKRGAGREPHDQHGVLDMLNTTARDQKGKKENTGRLKEEATKK